jgi:hypothetical protein
MLKVNNLNCTVLKGKELSFYMAFIAFLSCVHPKLLKLKVAQDHCVHPVEHCYLVFYKNLSMYNIQS